MNQPSTDPSKGKSFAPTDRQRIGKFEYLDGRVFAKASVSRWHSLISTNLISALGSRIQRGTCELYSSDTQVRIGRDSICFPDLTAVKGEPEFTGDSSETLVNPTVLVEIFPASSKSSYRAEKLEGFLAITSLKECLLVSESEMRVEHYAWQNAKQWIYRIYNERDDVITLDSINCKLSLAEVYAQVNLRESEMSSKAVN
jgi:Uma2 family endonuclease